MNPRGPGSFVVTPSQCALPRGPHVRIPCPFDPAGHSVRPPGGDLRHHLAICTKGKEARATASHPGYLRFANAGSGDEGEGDSEGEGEGEAGGSSSVVEVPGSDPEI